MTLSEFLKTEEFRRFSGRLLNSKGISVAFFERGRIESHYCGKKGYNPAVKPVSIEAMKNMEVFHPYELKEWIVNPPGPDNLGLNYLHPEDR